MSAKEEERLRDMLRKVTGAWNKCEARYEESQRLLYDAREELKTAQAVADGLQWQVDELRELVQSMHYDLAHQTFPPDWIGEYEEDMRKLGIEVDE